MEAILADYPYLKERHVWFAAGYVTGHDKMWNDEKTHMAAEQGQAMKRKETMSTDDFEMPKDRSRLLTGPEIRRAFWRLANEIEDDRPQTAAAIRSLLAIYGGGNRNCRLPESVTAILRGI